MSLFRGKLFAGALYAGALFGALQSVQPPEPPVAEGGGAFGGQRVEQRVQQVKPRKVQTDAMQAAKPRGTEKVNVAIADAKPTQPQVVAPKGDEKSSQSAKFAQNTQKTGVDAPKTANREQGAPNFEVAQRAARAAQEEREQREAIAKQDDEAALAMLAFMMSDDV